MKKIMATFVLTTGSIAAALIMILYPDETFNASIRGLNMWWEVVFPSLLPFFITAELLIGFGVVQFIGNMFEPVMRPIFNVPGVGSFAWAMGMASGYPAGAKISTRLRQEGQISKIEAERLVSSTNASSPLFIFAAIAVGFFHDVHLGLLLAASHYGGNILVGICMRFHGGKKDKKNRKPSAKRLSPVKAWKDMHRTRIQDDRQIGEVLGDAVVHSVNTLLMIGGFIILFSVVTKLITVIGILPLVSKMLAFIIGAFGLPAELAGPFLNGLFEITLGAQQVSKSSDAGYLAQIIIVSFMLGFNGFSVQAQVASITGKTDIRFLPYFLSRIMHGLFASILSFLLFRLLYLNRLPEDGALPAIKETASNGWMAMLHMLQDIGPMLTIAFLGIACFILWGRKRKRLY